MSGLVRANRISVSTNEDGVMVARFHKTHRLIAEIKSTDMDVQYPTGINKTALREIFRAHVINNAGDFGVLWQPEVMSNNIMPAKYHNDEILQESVCKIIANDITKWVQDINNDIEKTGRNIELVSIEADNIQEVTNHKGKEVQPTYNNGNWAWANIPVTVSIKAIDNTIGYVSMICKLVSGQLKKPENIGEGNYNYTNFRAELYKDLGDLIEAPKEVKVSQVVEDSIPENLLTIDEAIGNIESIVTEEPKPKKKRAKKNIVE